MHVITITLDAPSDVHVFQEFIEWQATILRPLIQTTPREMKNVLSIATVLLLSLTCYAQGVKIGETSGEPHSSSILDLESSDKGVLIPRIALLSIDDSETIASPATSLLVFNTNEEISGGNGSGFYFWNGTQWTAVGGSNSAGDAACTGVTEIPGPIVGQPVVSANTVYTFFVPELPGNPTYVWNYSGTGAVISGTSNKVGIYFASNATSGNLTVTATCGQDSEVSAVYPISVIPVAQGSITFSTTGMHAWIVPSGVFEVTADCYGAQGQTNNASGGLGGRARGKINVYPGQALYLFVGSTNGWNGGGIGYTSGGGASDVRIGNIDLGSRVIVAGGGGGAVNSAGGAGGGFTAGNGVNHGSAGGGGGATQLSGGAGGTPNGLVGSLGRGADGPRGGGGGGYYGGGGGGSASNSWPGGGGGSSYFAPEVTILTNSQGVRTGDGQIILSY